MAEKKKYRRAKKNDILLPHVADAPASPVSDAEQSEEKARADRKVEDLIRSLFGEKKQGGVAVAARDEEADGIVEPKEPSPANEVARDGKPEAGVASAEDVLSEPELQELSLKDQIESSAADFRLLLDMGYEQELGEAIGFERIRAYHEKNMNGKRASRRAGAGDRHEFEKQSEDAEVRRRYARERRAWFLRLSVSLLILLFLLFYENAPLMAKWFGGPLDGAVFPVSYILIGLQILLLDAVLCYRPLLEGLWRLLRFCPENHSAHAAILLAGVLYHIVVLFLPISEYPVLILSPAALSISLLAAGKLLDLYREGFAFDVVAARKQKYAILPRASVGGLQSSARAELAADDRDGSVWYLRPVGFVRNYFTNTARRGERHQNLGAHFLLIAGVGVAVALFSFAGGAQSPHVFAFFFVAALLCAPAISSLLTSLPLFFCACFCLRNKGAIIGEAALELCDGKDTLVLPDTDLFAAMEHEHFQLIDLCDAHRVTVLLRALLEKVQSPLANAFSVDTTLRVSAGELTLTHLSEGGICAEVRQTKTTVAIGTAAYMRELEIALPASESEQAEDPHRLLVAVDGCACAAFLVRYVPAADLSELLKELEGSGVKIVVRSKDPCVRDCIFEEFFPELKAPVTVQRPFAGELEIRTDRVDSCVVSLGSCKELARTYVACRRVRRVGRVGKFLQILSLLAGGALAALLSFFDYLPAGGWITLWMLLWCAVYALTSYFYLRRPTDDI